MALHDLRLQGQRGAHPPEDLHGRDEATLKRFYKYGDVVVLRGENPEFKELTFSGEQLEQVKILGKAVAFQSDVR